MYSTATTESTNLENKLHTVSISFLKNNIGTEGIEINRFYYQNPQEIPTDENPPSVKIPEYANRIHSSKFTLHGSWAESGNTGGQYTKKPGDWAEYSFVGTQFWIKGKIGNDHGKMQIILDGKRKYIVDNYNEEINQDFLMFSSLKLENTNHTIKIINVNKVTEITYLYYLDSPEGENIRFVKIDEFQEDYGTEWKTNTESTGKYTSQIDSQISCTYGGTQFWIYGKKGPKHGIIHVILDGDEKNKLEINCSSQTEQYYALLYKPLENITYKKHNVSILYPNIPENNGKSIEINKFFYYRPDEPMPDELPPLTEIHQFAYKVTIDRLSYNGVWRGDDEKYTTEVGASAEYSFKGTRFWIRGKIAPNHGRMRIEVDEDKYYIVNTKQNITNYDYLLFSSYELTDSEHSIKIICLDEPIEIKYIFFVSSSPKGDNIKYANAIGFKYEDSAQWSNSNNVFEGLWTTTKNSKALFTFYGTEFWLYGKIAPNHGIIQLNIDNEHSPTVNCHSEKEDSNILLYHSSGLNPSFDYHTIEISYIDNSVGNEGIQINRLYYQQPNNTNIELPGEIVSSPIHANAISAHKFTMDTYWGNGNSGGKYSENNGASMTFKFTGYQFWIQGKVAPHHGKMQLIVDNSVSYIIDTQNEQSEDQHLMFSSSKIENKEHTVTIINVDAVVEITYLLYLNTPEIKNLQYVNVQDFQLENGNWKDLDESQGKFTSEKGSKITYSFQGSSFWLYGRKAPSYGIISIVVDDNEEDSKTINCYSETTDYYALLMNPYHLLYGNHTISISYPDIEENNDKTGVEINRLYHYKPEGPTPEDQVPPTVVIPENAISIHSSTFERDADWDISGNTGGIYSGQLGATAIAKFTGCQFWIKGKVAPHHGNMQIIIDDEITYIVNTRLETNNDYLMFSSNILQNKEHTIKFIQIDYVIEIVTLHFISIPEPDISTDSTEEVSTMIQPTEDKPTPEKPTPIEPTEDKSKPEEPTPEKPTTIPPTPEKPINPSDVIPSNATLIEFDQMKNKDWSIKDGKASTGIAGSFLEFGFNGSQLFIVGYKNKGTGILKVIIDGKYENIDTNSVNQVDTTLLYPTTLNKVNLLNIEITEGAHRVKLEHSGPNGNLIQLHSVYILGEESGFNISSVTDSTNDNSETNGENDSKLQPGAIVGIVIAALIVVLVAVIFAYFFIHIKRRNVSHAQTSAEMTVETDNFYSGDLTDKYQSNSQSQENRFYNSSDSNHSVEDILNYNFEEGE
ncbi:hypothetical protein TRFO_30160 [Tritrichomonas foetus]|uniref:Uncharacterized protein n=1 Tax=Tritrichomonas foetus TaxID=1144522 RepID=A0A1J4JZL7_9EUKA|nr:hypothetical protein TRFO_30160 [Tritrichomonas foetus]|eukprot:OHT02701.1 hypothetical protein TRFO_30160 [Tritrichomonas foetus]